MSRIKKLRENPENVVNVADIFDRMFSKKSKYTELFIKILKEKEDFNNLSSCIRNDLARGLDMNSDDLMCFNNTEIMTLSEIIRGFGINDFKVLLNFILLNERNLIENNDITTYKTIDDVRTNIISAEIKMNKKSLEKQIKLVFEDDNWILLRPLTHLSSRKYGANTRWCTTSIENKYTFYEYSERNALVYCINKKNGLKVAALKDMGDGNQRISFWNSEDERVDSLESELPNYILDEIKRETTDNPYPNVRFLPDDYFNSDEYREYLKMYERPKEQIIPKQPIPIPMEQPQIVNREDVVLKREYDANRPSTSSDGDYGNTQSSY